MIDINEVRKQFAEYLNQNADRRRSLDSALMHVVELAYLQGMADAKGSQSEQADKEPSPADRSLFDLWLNYPQLSVSYDREPEPINDAPWLCHEESGSPNDTEWRLVGRGRTPEAALTMGILALRMG